MKVETRRFVFLLTTAYCLLSTLPSVLLGGGRRGRAAEGAADAAAGAAGLLDGVVRGHLEERGRRLRARDVSQAVSRLAGARVAVARHDGDLELGRVPVLVHDLDRRLVADLAGGDRDRRARALGRDAVERAGLELLGLRLVLRTVVQEGGALARGRGVDDDGRAGRRGVGAGHAGEGALDLELLGGALHGLLACVRRVALDLKTQLPARHLARGLRGGFEDVAEAGDGVVDEDRLRLLARGGVGADVADRLLAARAPLGVAVELRGVLAHDAVAVRERLHRLGHALRRVGRALDELAAEAHLGRHEHDAVAADFDRGRRRRARPLRDEYLLLRGGGDEDLALALLRGRPGGVQQQRPGHREDD